MKSPVVMLSFTVFALTSGSEAKSQVSGQPQCAADSFWVARIGTQLLSMVPQKSPETRVVPSESQEDCQRALKAWPVDSARVRDRPYVFVITGAPKARYAIVYLNPGYPTKSEWPLSVCFFDATWKGMNPCVVF